MWLKEFKLAIILKDANKISSLMDEIPQFKNLQEMQEAYYLIEQAREIIQDYKNSISQDLVKIKQNIQFIESTQKQKKNKLDINS
jgi:hypothetical protein